MYKFGYISLFLLLILYHPAAFTDTTMCQMQSGGVLDKIVESFASSGLKNSWHNQISQIAKTIFFILFSTEFMWQLTIKKVFAGDIEKLWVFFFTRMILCLFYATYLININFYQGIINYISNLGGELSGFILTTNQGNNFSTLSPSMIISNFSCISNVIHQLADSTSGINYITTKFTLAIMQVCLFIILSFIAFAIIKVFIQTYFLLYAGFILVGFAGSSWTFNFWQKYLQSISYVAIKFLATSFIMGVLLQQMNSWAIDINNATNDLAILAAVLLKILGSSIIIVLIIYQLPEWAASSLAGQINLSFDTVSSFMAGSGSNRTHQQYNITPPQNSSIVSHAKAILKATNISNQTNQQPLFKTAPNNNSISTPLSKLQSHSNSKINTKNNLDHDPVINNTKNINKPISHKNTLKNTYKHSS